MTSMSLKENYQTTTISEFSDNQNNTEQALEQVSYLIENELSLVEKVIQRRLQSEVPSVTQIANYIVGSGGKRIRPILCILAARALGSHDHRCTEMAAAIEFVHTATLLHDDVIDNSQLRRGRPSCNAIWDNKMSILVGDFLYCQVSSMITEDGDLKVLKCITDATTWTTEGEVLEVTKSRNLHLSQAEYFKIIEFKTGMLMACATQVGAILAKSSPEIEQAMHRFGMSLGIAFQLADDALDYISTDLEFGKKTGIDLQEGKITLPLLYTLENCTESEKEIIREGTINASESIFQEVLRLLKKYEAIEFTLQLADQYIQESQNILSQIEKNSYQEALMQITNYVTKRNK